MVSQIYLDHFALKLFNTASRKKETLIPIHDRHVRNVHMRAYCIQFCPYWKLSHLCVRRSLADVKIFWPGRQASDEPDRCR